MDQEMIMAIRSVISGIDRLNNSITNCSMLLIFPLIGVMLLDVFIRYFLNSPVIWGTELGMMIFGLYMIFSGPSSVLDKVQVGIDLFSSKWKPQTRGVVSCITYIFTAVLFFQLIITSAIYALESWEMQEVSCSAWGQPVYHWKALIPVAFFLTFLQTIAEFLRNFWLALTGKELE